jgi:hypothetical protein
MGNKNEDISGWRDSRKCPQYQYSPTATKKLPAGGWLFWCGAGNCLLSGGLEQWSPNVFYHVSLYQWKSLLGTPNISSFINYSLYVHYIDARRTWFIFFPHPHGTSCAPNFGDHWIRGLLLVGSMTRPRVILLHRLKTSSTYKSSM